MASVDVGERSRRDSSLRPEMGSRGFDKTIVVVAGITLLALALRIRGMTEGLYQDELYTFREMHAHSLPSMLNAVANGLGHGTPLENNPPLYPILAWLSAKLGNDTVWIRLPSVVLGAATVPLVYALGRRVAGRIAAVVAAAFIAFSPFAIFYGTEARAYATLMFLGVLTTLLLIRAVNRGTRVAWLGYGVSVVALLYTHYTGVIALAVQVAWVLWFHRDRIVPLAITYAGASLVFAVWIPYVRSNETDYGALAALIGVGYGEAALQWLAGSPNSLPGTVPGLFALLVLGGALVVAVVGAAIARTGMRSGHSHGARNTPEWALLIALALAGPLACLLYGTVGVDLFLFPRNMIISLPFVGVLLGRALTAPGRVSILAAALGLAAVGLTIGVLKTLDSANQRPDFPALARRIDASAGPRDVVVVYGGGYDAFILSNHLAPYLRRPHIFAGASTFATGSVERALQSHSAGSQRGFVAELESRRSSSLPQVRGWRTVGQQLFPGTDTLVFTKLERLRPG